MNHLGEKSSGFTAPVVGTHQDLLYLLEAFNIIWGLEGKQMRFFLFCSMAYYWCIFWSIINQLLA